MSDNVYFAAKEPEKTAGTLLAKANTWYNQLHSNGYLTKVQNMWAAYHGAYNTGLSGGHKISFSGEQGELVNLAVNHLRNIGQHMIRMITANRPAMQARAANKDYKSLVQTKLANELLDYYLREKRLEKYLERAVEYAVVFGTGFIKMEWNATTGEVYEINEETGAPIYEGDVQFANLSPYDVVFDMTKEDQNHDWVLCRTWKSKYDLAAKYPEMGDKIKGLATKSDYYKYRFDMMSYEETDDVAVYEFYHKKTEALPDGRYLLFLDGDLVLNDSPMPYRQLPIYRVSPSDILGTPYGYTPLFDLLPIQDAVNSLYSTILTNQHAFGVQNIYIPRGADVIFKSLSGGLNLVEGNSQAGKPEALNLTQTPAEIFNFLKILETTMETISGINSVSRGNPEASLKSGAALALVQSMSLQFMSGLQSQYIQLLEDVGTGLINMLKDFASVPRIAMIAGKSNRSYVEHEFSGDDLGQVNRVIVDAGNPLARTTAGKVQLAESLIQYGIVQSPEQYFQVLNSGRLDVMTDDAERELLLIEGENERMAEGRDAHALVIDQHRLHIKMHKTLLADPDLRDDQELAGKVLNHIQEHIDMLRNTDPGTLSTVGEQPLGPIGGSAPAPGPGQEAPNNSQAPNMQGGPVADPNAPPAPPDQPAIPQVDANLLPNPQIQEQNVGNLKQ
jgi:hypothetical protein